jgi:hypothetical protein
MTGCMHWSRGPARLLLFHLLHAFASFHAPPPTPHLTWLRAVPLPPTLKKRGGFNSSASAPPHAIGFFSASLRMTTGRVRIGWSFRVPKIETRSRNPNPKRTLIEVEIHHQNKTRGYPKPERIPET